MAGISRNHDVSRTALQAVTCSDPAPGGPRRPAMTPRWLSMFVVLQCAVLSLQLTGAHEHSDARRRSPADPPTTRLVATIPYLAPIFTQRKCGHRPLLLTERRRRAKQLEPFLRQARQRQARATFQPGRRRLLNSAAAAAAGDGSVTINIYWHLVALSSASYRPAMVVTLVGAQMLSVPQAVTEHSMGRVCERVCGQICQLQYDLLRKLDALPGFIIRCMHLTDRFRHTMRF